MAGNSNLKRKGEDLKAAKDKKRFNPSLQQPGESSASGANRPQEGSINEGTQWFTDLELHEISENPEEAFVWMKRSQDETKRSQDETKRSQDETKRSQDETKRSQDKIKNLKSEIENKDEQQKEENRKSWKAFLNSYSSTLQEYNCKRTIKEWVKTIAKIGDKTYKNNSVWINLFTRFPGFFSKEKKKTATKSAASNSASSDVIDPEFMCKKISDNTMKFLFHKCVENYVTSNHDQDFEVQMAEAHGRIFGIKIKEMAPLKKGEVEKESRYTNMVRNSVYSIGEKAFSIFFPYESETEIDVTFKLKILSNELLCDLRPDLNAILYCDESWPEGKRLGVMVGEVKLPSIEPVVTLLNAWSAGQNTINLEESENKKYAAILNQELGYMIASNCRTGVLTDSQLYIYLKFDPGETDEASPVLSYYTTEASNHYIEDENASVSPRAAMIGMMGTVMLEKDLANVEKETTKMFSRLLSFVKKSYVQLYFSPDRIEENFNHFKKDKKGFEGCISSEFEPIKEHIKVTVDHHERFRFYQAAKGFNSMVIEVSSEFFEVLGLNDMPESIMAKVFDHNYAFMTHAGRTYLTLMSEMIKTYSCELEKYRKIEEYNKKNKSRPINTPKFYANGFFSLRNSGRYVPIEDTDYIATGPCILMEKLVKEDLTTNEQFEKGLIQLVRLHKAGISHKDIKDANVICTKDNFYFIDYGLSVEFALVTPPSSSQAESSQTEQSQTEQSQTEQSQTEQSQTEQSQTEQGPSTESTSSDADLTDFIGLWKQKVTEGCTAEDTIRQKYKLFMNILV